MLVIPLRRLGELTFRSGAADPQAFAPTSLVTLGHYLYALDGSTLGLFPDPPRPGSLHPLGPEMPDCDLNALVYVPHIETFAGYPIGALLALPRSRRPDVLIWRLDDRRLPSAAPIRVDVSALLEAVKERLVDLDIVAAAVNGTVLSLFHDGARSGTARIDVDLPTFVAAMSEERGPAPDCIETVRFYELPGKDGSRLRLVDASPLRDARVVFAACGGSGSSIGVMDTHGQIQTLQPVSAPARVSGLAAQLEAEAIDVLLSASAGEATVLFAAELAR
jgi:Family of unknown function (DUF6910)